MVLPDKPQARLRMKTVIIVTIFLFIILRFPDYVVIIDVACLRYKDCKQQKKMTSDK